MDIVGLFFTLNDKGLSAVYITQGQRERPLNFTLISERKLFQPSTENCVQKQKRFCVGKKTLNFIIFHIFRTC